MNISVKNTFKYQYVSIGMIDTLKVMAIPKDFNKLNHFQVLNSYRLSSNRVLFFDVEGTLLKFIQENEAINPSNKVLSALEELCRDPHNTIVLITGRERHVLNKWFKDIEGLNMAAEYGTFLKLNSDDWEDLSCGTCNWKENSRKIIESHVQRIEGSYIIVKERSVVFNYKEAESGFGQWQARDLIYHLENQLNSEDCEISRGNGFIEVRPKGIDKGTTLYKVLGKIYQNKGLIDFVFTIGDDFSDEKMFKMIKVLKKKNCIYLSNDIKSFTCTFGVKPSEAINYFLNADEVLKLMELLSTSGGKRSNSFKNLAPRHSAHQFTSINVNTILKNHVHRDSQDISEIFSPRVYDY